MSLWPRITKILISNWPRTRKFSQLFKITAGKTFPYYDHALVTLYVQFLCSDCSKFDRWVQAENLCSILKLVYFGRWSWQSFVSTCDVFNCLFPLDVMKHSCYQESSVIHGMVCLLGFWLRNASLVKVGNPISAGIVFVFHLAGYRFKVSSDSGLNTVAFRSCISNGKPEELLYLMFVFFISNLFMKSITVYAASLSTFVRWYIWQDRSQTSEQDEASFRKVNLGQV